MPVPGAEGNQSDLLPGSTAACFPTAPGTACKIPASAAGCPSQVLGTLGRGSRSLGCGQRSGSLEAGQARGESSILGTGDSSLLSRLPACPRAPSPLRAHLGLTRTSPAPAEGWKQPLRMGEEGMCSRGQPQQKLCAPGVHEVQNALLEGNETLLASSFSGGFFTPLLTERCVRVVQGEATVSCFLRGPELGDALLNPEPTFRRNK